MSTPVPAEDQPAADPAAAPAAATATSPEPVDGRRRAVLLLAGLAVLVIALDLISKIVIVAHLRDGESRRILGGLVYLSLYRNSGAAFSMATGMTWILTLIVIGVIIAIVRIARRLRATIWAVSLGLVLGGAIGNLIDRLFRAPGFLRGHVVDFISLFGPDARYFAIFNVADSAITCGGVVLVIAALIGVDVDGSRTRRARAERSPDTPTTPPDMPADSPVSDAQVSPDPHA